MTERHKLEVMKLGGALALLGLLLWAASYSELGMWFLVPACISGGVSVLMFIVYVIIVDGSERDVDYVTQASLEGVGRQFDVPFVRKSFDKNEYDHSGHASPGRLELAFRRWISRPRFLRRNTRSH